MERGGLSSGVGVCDGFILGFGGGDMIVVKTEELRHLLIRNNAKANRAENGHKKA